jgi:hypothetical protein
MYKYRSEIPKADGLRTRWSLMACGEKEEEEEEEGSHLLCYYNLLSL